MSVLPPPSVAHPPRRGRLSAPWRRAVVLTNVVFVAALVAAAATSRAIGKPTWWFGSDAYPAFVLLWAVPFLGPVASILAAIRWPHRCTAVGLASAVVLAASGAADLRATPGVAVIVLAVGGCALLAAVATIAGRVRLVEAPA